MDAQDHETPQGPADPHGPGGIDAPTPPGGPQRTDAPGTGETPGENAPDPGPEDPGPDAGSSSGGQIPEPVHDPDSVSSDEERAEQAENAGTSLDQPSG